MLTLHYLLVAALAVVVSSLPTANNVDEAWNDFKATYGRQYRSLYEETVRKDIFSKNFLEVISHNQLYEAGQVSYTLKTNKYSDLFLEERKQKLNGYKKSKVASDIEVIEFVPDPDVSIPDEFDWREKGAVTPVKDQGYCGSCWAFSTTGALEGQYFRKTGKLASISEQNLVDCSFEHNNHGCDGGDMNPAFTYIHNNDGIDSETSYPYKAIDETCRYVASGNVTSLRGYATIENGNEEYLKAAVATIGPIAVAIDASQNDFGLYSDGIYYNPNCNDGSVDPETTLDHAVLAVGYGTENGQDYWLIKNSWGTSWGNKGYIKMARNRNNNCGVAAETSFPLNY